MWANTSNWLWKGGGKAPFGYLSPGGRSRSWEVLVAHFQGICKWHTGAGFGPEKLWLPVMLSTWCSLQNDSVLGILLGVFLFLSRVLAVIMVYQRRAQGFLETRQPVKAFSHFSILIARASNKNSMLSQNQAVLCNIHAWTCVAGSHYVVWEEETVVTAVAAKNTGMMLLQPMLLQHKE